MNGNLNQNKMAEEAKMALLLFTVGMIAIAIGLINKYKND
jgi:hypothetical protein